MLRITVFSIILMVTFVATSLAQENMAPTIMGPETLTIDELVLSTGTRTVQAPIPPLTQNCPAPATTSTA